MNSQRNPPPMGHSINTDHATSGNHCGILMSIESGHIRLAKQTSFGDEYVVTAPDATTAWIRLSRITGSSARELKQLRLTRVQS